MLRTPNTPLSLAAFVLPHADLFSCLTLRVVQHTPNTLSMQMCWHSFPLFCVPFSSSFSLLRLSFVHSSYVVLSHLVCMCVLSPRRPPRRVHEKKYCLQYSVIRPPYCIQDAVYRIQDTGYRQTGSYSLHPRVRCNALFVFVCTFMPVPMPYSVCFRFRPSPSLVVVTQQKGTCEECGQRSKRRGVGVFPSLIWVCVCGCASVLVQ